MTLALTEGIFPRVSLNWSILISKRINWDILPSRGSFDGEAISRINALSWQ